MAGLKSMVGDQKEAVKWINRAIKSKWIDLAMVEHIPFFEELRSNPEYKNTIRNLEADLLEMRQKADKLK